VSCFGTARRERSWRLSSQLSKPSSDQPSDTRSDQQLDSDLHRSATSPLLINLAFLSAKPTGHTTYALNLFPELGPDTTLLTSQNFPQSHCHPIPTHLNPDYGIRGHSRRILWTQFWLPQLYRQLGARLLFSPIPEAPLFSQMRHVVTLHDLIPVRFPRHRSPLTPYFRYYVPQVLRQAQHVICDSEATARDAMQYCQIPAAQLTVVPLSHDNQHFRWLDLPRQNYFLYVGRHDPYKNLDRVIAAFAQLGDREVELWIAGPPDRRYTSILTEQVASLGLADRVKFLSYVPYDELPILLNQALALVFPSLWEGFGLPVLEAMACGAPVITSNLSSLPEVAGDAALLVDPYRVGAIAEAMQAICQDGKLRADLSGRSRHRAAQFSWRRTGEATRAILQRYL
jgi:glycosyltransferase involved in cell wall biosynthesis